MLKHFLIVILFGYGCLASYAQPHTDIDLDRQKPKEYQNRKLQSEKTGEKKFTIIRRITQNTYSHYNYYFNAYQKYKKVIEKAKLGVKDDYTKLLPFYNYTLDATAASKEELDSIIYKCTAGILLHDLRSDWVDNLYLLMGKAYLLRKDFDSAAGCFQYINYVYAPKDDGYDIPLGSNSSGTKGVFTISTKETKNLWKQITTHKPSRNEGFIWQIRNYLEQDLLGEAAGLIGILHSDPYFPKRLHTQLYEMTAYWYYKQENFDSAAVYLQKALPNAEDRTEKSRWEYLIAQMYQHTGKDSLSNVYYEKAITHTIDPLMEVYARLNMVTLASGKKKNPLEENINELIKLAKKDKYTDYRDIIYYAAAQLELKRNGEANAKSLLQKSIKYSVNNLPQKSKSFLLLGEISYNNQQFIDAAAYYDSVQTETLGFKTEKERNEFTAKKAALKIISTNLQIVEKEDSLQKIAALPEAERIAFVKKLAKTLRKARGLKTSDEPDYGSAPITQNTKATDLFGNNDTKGEWYFLNTSLRTKGYNEFKSKWGKRPNVDNWRRQEMVEKQQPQTSKQPADFVGDMVDDVGTTTTIDAGKNEKQDAAAKEKAEDDNDISFEGLMSKLPLTEERLEASHLKIQNALFTTGNSFQEMIEDYANATNPYKSLLNRYKTFSKKEKTLFNLYYCYKKLGMQLSADSVKQILEKEFADSKSTEILQTAGTKKENPDSVAATKMYENIYSLFVEGKYQEAVTEKAKADQKYGNSYWTPQLLYIEAIFYVQQQQDSLAVEKLNEVIKRAPGTPLADKATNMLTVLSKRKEIVDYLTNLEIERKEDEVSKMVDLTNPKDIETATTVKTNANIKKTRDVSTDKLAAPPSISINSNKGFIYEATDAHFVMVYLNNIDKVFASEAKGAFEEYNRSKISFRNIPVKIENVQTANPYILIGPFTNAGKAVDYVDIVKPITATQIISFIPVNKYGYSIISAANLALVQQQNNLADYLQFINNILPGKF